MVQLPACVRFVGGVGKTTVMATLAEWYASTAYTADLFDMDPDNKAEGCFKALFSRAHKLPALESWTYDKLLGISLESSADVILADLVADLKRARVLTKHLGKYSLAALTPEIVAKFRDIRLAGEDRKDTFGTKPISSVAYTS
jgi:hypothetical protein